MSELQQIKSEMTAEYDRIMRYWITQMPDEQLGGFYGERDKHNTLVPDAPKGCILNGRMLWSFATATRIFGKPEYRKAADRAFDYLTTYFYDAKNGGFFWSLNADGSPLDTKKQAYALGFCIYGLSEYARATGNQLAIDLAVETFHVIEKHFRDRQYGGYIEALAADWSPLDDVRLSDKDENTPKSMNTHLHIIEPYANLYRVAPSLELYDAIDHLLHIFTEKIIDTQTGHFQLFFDVDWTLKSNIDSYGHDIEGAWLLMEAAEVIGSEKWVDKLRPICKRLTDVTLAEAWCGDSIYYEKVDGKVDTDKHWWPQAETLVGLTDTWRLTGDEEYLRKMQLVWRFISDKLIDRKYGEWLWRVDKEGRDVYNDCKAGFWKCPYHNSRAIAEVLERIK
ncbi:MAG: AGE family epimerase/isomerase [Marinilabiliaceae bacterium]|nr:AGE family epimerase/isomerase [Marinilabiliaceae bacterium]